MSRRRPVHAAQGVLDDVGDLVGERGVVVHAGRVRGGEQRGVTVLVLKSLAVEGGAPGRRAEQESAAQLVAEGPHLVAGALEAEHRVEDVHRDHELAVRRIRGARGGHGRHRAGLADPLMEHLARLGLAVGQQQVPVHGFVLLPVRRVDLRRREQGVHPEGARLVRNDRDEPVAELGVLHEVLQQPDEGHRRRDGLLARSLVQLRVRAVTGAVHVEGPRPDDPPGQRAAQGPPGAPACTGSPRSSLPASSRGAARPPGPCR